MNSYIPLLVFNSLGRTGLCSKLFWFVPCVNQKSRLCYLTQKHVWHCSTTTSAAKSSLFSSERFLECNFNKHNHVSVRSKHFKKQKGKGKGEESDSDVDEMEDVINELPDNDDDELVKDYKDITAYMNSLRIDAVIKNGLGMSRNKVVDAFYAGNLRVNGEKVLKKGHPLTIGDESDLIVGVSKTNPDLLVVSRVVIMNVSQMDSDRLKVKLRRFKNLTIPKLKDGFKPQDSESQE